MRLSVLLAPTSDKPAASKHAGSMFVQPHTAAATATHLLMQLRQLLRQLCILLAGRCQLPRSTARLCLCRLGPCLQLLVPLAQGGIVCVSLCEL